MAANPETIKEFLVSLGFKVDETQQAAFSGALESATLRGNIFADVIVEAMKKVVDAVSSAGKHIYDAGQNLEELNNAAIRMATGGMVAAPEKILAFRNAIAQLGGTTGEAMSSLDKFSEWVRHLGSDQNAQEFFRSNFKIDIAGKSAPEVMQAVFQWLRTQPANVQQYWAGQFNIGAQERNILLGPEMSPEYQRQLQVQQASGLDAAAIEKAAAATREFNKEVGEFQTHLLGIEAEVIHNLNPLLDQIDNWIRTHPGEIKQASEEISKDIKDIITSLQVMATQLANLVGDPLLKYFIQRSQGDHKTDDTFWQALTHSRLLGPDPLLGPQGLNVIPAPPDGGTLGPNIQPPAPATMRERIKSFFDSIMNFIIEPAEGETLPQGGRSSGGPHGGGFIRTLGNAIGITAGGNEVSTGNPLPVHVVSIDPNAAGPGGAGSGFLGGPIGSGGPLPSGGAARGATPGVDYSGTPAAPVRGAGAFTSGQQGSLARQAYDYWRAQGLNHEAATAMVANERGENVLGSLAVGDRGTAFGQGQWHQDRVNRILAGSGIDVKSAGFMEQQAAMKFELEHYFPDLWKRLQRGDISEREALWGMIHEFEVSGDQKRDMAVRSGYAGVYGRFFSGAGAALDAPAPAPAHSPTEPYSRRRLDSGASDAPGTFPLGHPHPVVGPLVGQPHALLDHAAISHAMRGADAASRATSINAPVTNSITVHAPDPHTAAAMVALNLDRSASDVARNLQGAIQ